MDDRLFVEVVHGSHDAILEFLLRASRECPVSHDRAGHRPLRRRMIGDLTIRNRGIALANISRILRLRAGGMSKRKIAASLSIGATAAGDCLRRARRAGLSWPLPEDLSDEALERLLYPPPSRPDRGRTGR